MVSRVRYISARNLIVTGRAVKIQRRQNLKGFKWAQFVLVIHAAGHNPVKYYVVFNNHPAALAAGGELVHQLAKFEDDDDLYNNEIQLYLDEVQKLLRERDEQDGNSGSGIRPAQASKEEADPID